MRKVLAFAFVVLVSASAVSGQRVVLSPNGILPALESYLEALRVQAGIPGMSAAVVKDGEIIWERGFGFQDVASRIRPTAETPYMVGDASGTLAAVLLLQCVEQRRLELDRPLSAYGIEIPEPAATLRQILSHTGSGTPPEPFQYNPGRYAQLGAVMEWCAPQEYRKSVSHRVLKRFAMVDSVPGTDLRDAQLPLPAGMYEPADLQRYRAVLEKMAVPYRVDSRGRPERVEVPVEPMSAVGGLVSTVRDLARFDAALDQRSVLLDETRALAWNPVTNASGAASPSGLGWFVQPYRGHRIVWHFGQVPNAYSSLIVKLPDHNLTFILLANSDRLTSPFQLHTGDVSRSLFAALFLNLIT